MSKIDKWHFRSINIGLAFDENLSEIRSVYKDETRIR